MEKITQKEFINKINNYDSAMICSTSNKSFEEIKEIIENNSILDINFNRQAICKGQNIQFKYLKDDKVNTSHLGLLDTIVYKYNDFYIVEDKGENYNYQMIYAISDKKTLNLVELEKIQIENEKIQALKDEETEKQNKINEHKKELESYFNHKFWNKEKINKLTPLQFGRLKKSLEKQYRYDGTIRTVKENIEFNEWDKKEIGKASINYKHYDKLCDHWGYDTVESREYKEKISNKKIYELYYKNDIGSYTEIPKIIFDILIDDFSVVDTPTNFLKNDITLNRENTINAILDYTHTPKEHIQEIENLSDKDLYFHLENFCLTCNDDFKKVLKKFNCISFEDITKDNIHLYYEFMSIEDLEKYSDILGVLFIDRTSIILNLLFPNIQELRELEDYLKTDVFFQHFGIYKATARYFFGTKDTLKPIDEYIEEIKASSEYKEYISTK